MHAMNQRQRLILLAVAGALPVLLGRIVLATTPVQLHEAITPTSQLVNLALGAIWIAVMLFSYGRAPGEPFWKLVLVRLWADQIWLLFYIPTSLTWTASNFDELADVLTAHIIVSFPSGRLRDRFDRAVVWFIYGYVLLVNVVGMLVFRPDWMGNPECTDYCPDNLLLVAPNDTLVAVIDQASSLGVPFLGLLLLAAVVRRWRLSTPIARRVMLPILVATPLFIVLRSAWYLARAFEVSFVTNTLADWSFAAIEFIIPVGLLLAVLRARLARGAVADLAIELAHGVPIGELRNVLARAIGDPTLRLAFPAPDGDGYVDELGRPIQVPLSDTDSARITRIENEGELLAVMVHDPAIDRDNPGLVDAVGSMARLALANERLSAQVRAQLEEVRASRARIVEAADVERQRIERDLHDGAQQRLVALAMRLELARTSVTGAQALIDETTAELTAAIGEVRGLARGVHPTILTEMGLAPALEALAERSAVPVTIDAPDKRFPPPVEATAYFLAAEALTNVARYAEARRARIVIEERDGALVVRVEDDGRGGADPTRGTGLRGLVDRVQALGGVLTVDSPDGAGTVLTATLPLT
jgi:signal transduction histidine kinase